MDTINFTTRFFTIPSVRLKLNSLLSGLIIIAITFSAPALHAQKVIQADTQSAGFRYVDDAGTTKPIIVYRHEIEMLSNVDDRLTLNIYGDGRVLVHYPVYMKRAGDYQMHLDENELASLLRSLSSNGVMVFDEKNSIARKKARKLAERSRGELHEISDGDTTSIQIELDEYQKNRSSKKVKNFRKHFRWKNIEHDARRYQSDATIKKANDSVLDLRALMKDGRLLRTGSR